MILNRHCQLIRWMRGCNRVPFNTYTFLIFFIVLLIIYHSVKNWEYQKTVLLIASYLFYSAWNPLFVLLLIFSTMVDWLLARKIFQAQTKSTKKWYLVISLAVNLGLLSYFKYGNFLLENSIILLGLFNIDFKPASLDIILPVGISFYTFQTLSYTIDTYRGKIQPSKSFLDYALYVSFFPQLVAGPIVRANDFLPQCKTPRNTSVDQFGWGLSLLTIGLFLKIIIADTILAPVVDKVYAAPEYFSSLETWTAILAFSGQIFADFSGYSTAAIGASLCLGFVLPDNFKAPYAALGFREFWQRWHISLSTWLRDYLYISLGGNRISSIRTSINLMITMLLGGLWHGASWLFVIWGGLHGLYLIIEHFITQRIKLEKPLSKMTQVLLIVLTFLIVSLTWVFFRAESLQDVITIFSNLHKSSSSHKPQFEGFELILALSTIVLLVSWHITTKKSSLETFFQKQHGIIKGLILTLMIMAIFLFASGDNRAFIYFQF